MSIDNYTLKIKEPCDYLGSNNVNIDEYEMVQICLGGLARQFGAIRSAVLVRENPLSFDLQSMLVVKENHVRTRSNESDGLMLYVSTDERRGQSHVKRGRLNQEQPHEHNFSYRQDVVNARGRASGRWGSNHATHNPQNNSALCGYCGKFGHYKAECGKKKSESAFTS